jgi:heptosyltransferase-2
MEKQIKKILIVRFSSLGDIILTEPIVRYLRIHYPEAKIDYLTKKAFKSVVQHFTGLNNILLWENKSALLKYIRNEQYDILIDLHDKFNTFIVKSLAFAQKTVTYEKKHLFRKLLVKKLLKDNIDSTLDLYFTVFKKIDKDLYEKYSSRENHSQFYPKILANTESVSETEELYQNYNINHNKTLIGVFPGASYNTKQYPLDYWINFLEMIPESWNCQFIILGSYEEKYQAIKIKNSVNIKPVDLCGKFNLSELIDFVSKLDGIISNDSGPMHIAAALNKPQIAIFGATNTILGFRPLNDKAIIMQSEIKCSPCSLHGGDFCPKKHFKCMRDQKPSLLLKQFKDLLEKSIWKL